MADQAIEAGKYDAKQTPEKNATADAAAIKTTFENDGAEKAYARLQQELDPKALAAGGATVEQQQKYQEAMVAQLKQSGVLPELSIAHAVANKKDLVEHGRVSGDKLYDAQTNAKTPVERALITELGNKYNKLKDAGMPLTEHVLKGQLDANTEAAKERAAGLQKQTDDRKNLGGLITNEKVFKEMSGGDGQITEDDAKAFKQKWRQVGEKGDQFRAEMGGPTREGQEQVRKMNEDVLKAFDDKRNDDNKKGAVIYDATWPRQNYMDKESLAKGMGYKDAADAATKLPTDTAAKPPVAVKDPVVESKPAVDQPQAKPLDFSNTALKRNEGPWHIAGQMMAGEKFNDPAKVREDLKNAVRTVFNDKEKAQQITPENLGKVRESIAKSGNEELSKWFDAKYPKSAEKAVADTPAAPAEVKVEAAKDFAATKLGKDEGSYHVAHRMTEGQHLSDSATKALQRVIASGFTDKQGAEQVNAANLEDVRTKVAATNNPELVAWFNKRYPKPTDRR